MDNYKAYIYFAFAIKIAFIITAITSRLIKGKGKVSGNANIALENKLEYWKDRLDFVFTFLMAFLLIYLFNPRNSRNIMMIDNETKILLFLFGIILLITAKWETFFTQSPLLTSLSK